jgi:hypothetical protein
VRDSAVILGVGDLVTVVQLPCGIREDYYR